MLDNKMERAQQVYKTLCSAIDATGWHYEKDEPELVAHFSVSSEDIPMKFIVFVDAQRQLVRLASPLLFKMSESKRMEGAIATCVATYTMTDGSFDYDLSDGEIVFRMAATYRESVLGEGLFQYMIACACAAVDRYNDLFLALDKGLISIADFIEKVG